MASTNFKVPRPIVGNTTSDLPQAEVQVGALHTTGLLDSGSVRSAVSFKLLGQLKETYLSLVVDPTSFEVVAVSHQPLLVLGEVRMTRCRLTPFYTSGALMNCCPIRVLKLVSVRCGPTSVGICFTATSAWPRTTI
jgi:hypothetical protein